MAGNFWEQDRVLQPGEVKITPIMSVPKQPTPQTPTQEAIDAERLEELRNPRPTLPAGYRLRPDGTAERIPGLPVTDTGEGKPVPAWAATPFEKQVGIYSGLAGSLSSFQDDFAGNTLTGGLENWAQGKVGSLGTEGQRDWWARFTQADNQIRNELFGATLTPGEQAAYASTSIEPSMDPAEIRRNLQTRRDIVKKALARKVEFLKAQGYNPDAISALAGEYAGDFAPEQQQSENEQNTEASPPVLPSPGQVEASPTGEGRFATERDKAFATMAQQAFDQGASFDDLNALALQHGYAAYGDDLKAAIDWRAKNGKGARISAPESGYKGPSVLGAAAATPVGSYFAGAANALSAGTVDEMAGALGGDQEQAQFAKEVMREQNPVASLAGELTGGALAMTGVGRVPGMAGRAVAGDVAYGAAYGAGDNNENRVGGALIGAGAAGMAHGLFRGIGAYRNRPAAVQRRAQRAADQQGRRGVLEAGQRQGVDVLPADVGGATTRRLTGAMAQGPVSAQPIVRGAQRVTEQAQAARDRVAANIGQALELEQAGEAARAGAQAFIQRTSQQARILYRQAETLAGSAAVPLTRATQVLDQHIAELGQVPGGADGLAALQSLRDEVAGGAFTVAGVRGMRTALRDRFISQGLRGSDLERRVNMVIEAANDDIATGLSAQGLDNAASAYRTADRYWRLRVQTIDNALAPIIGKDGAKSGEQVMQALNSAAKSDNAKLARFVRALPPEEQATVRATMIAQLGRGSNGTQNAAGDAFSLTQFLTHWNQMSPGAKRTLFAGDSFSALEDLARVADGSKQAQRYQNFSNTAGGLAGQGAVAAIPYALGDVVTAVAALGTQYGVGRLLASPSFARWLARAPRQGMPRPYIDRLQRIAAADASIAAEATGLRQALLSAANDNVGSAAVASDGEEQRAQ